MHIEQALATWLDPVRKAAEERAAEALLATAERQPARPSALVTAAELARRETAKLASSAPTRERLVRSAGNRKADWAAITRVEYDDKGAAEEELWEEELRFACNGDLFLASERERSTWTAAWMPGHVSERRAGRTKDEPCSRGLEEEGLPMPVSRADDLAYPDDETRERLLEHDDLWQLDTVEREQLAWLWLHSKFGAMYERLAGLCEQYERACREKLQLQQHMHLRVLRRARLVGMTRSALTQYAPLVAALECEVVVVDDAAEALESHTLIAITPSLTHLILCGDRQQVHPRSSVARLARTFRLPTSMLERLLVLRDKSHAAADMGARLTLQHRLPATLSRLLRPLYPMAEAVGGATAAGPPSNSHAAGPPSKGGVKGVERAVYMLKHSKPESVEASSRSRCNVHEAKFCAAFALYLMRQGYVPQQITVLAPYCGQLLTVQRELRALRVPGLEQVVTSLIDAYHGEENDIVLLSLVRSPPAALAGAVPGADKPPQGTLGLVGSEPRMGAALSRARLGLYLIGNAEALAADSKLWEVLLRYLNEGGAVGAFLPLQATRTETGKRALVRSGDDFDGVVGEWEQRLAEQHASAEKTDGTVV